MAKRRFQLPGIQDLSKEQEDVRALPLEGQHLIIGGPGTGKSVMALLRARRLEAEAKDYIFLVFNHLLKHASDQLFGANLTSDQWQRWFISLHKNVLRCDIPRLPAEQGSTFSNFDWQGILENATTIELDDTVERPYLIVDEGQDMPPEFYQALAHVGFENFFVVADQNQQIVNGTNSSRQDIENALGLGSDDVIELKHNYRNNFAIARLAREFYTEDPASPPPDLPPAPKYQVKKPLLFTYAPRQFPHMVQRILKMADNNPSKLIGLLCPNNNVRQKFYQALLKADPQLDNGKPKLTTFAAGDKHPVPFDEGGIVVINAQACKGLEFDTVFIADIDQFKCDATSRDRMQRLFYVMVARAIDHIILLRAQCEHCAVDLIMPKNSDILEKK